VGRRFRNICGRTIRRPATADSEFRRRRPIYWQEFWRTVPAQLAPSEEIGRCRDVIGEPASRTVGVALTEHRLRAREGTPTPGLPHASEGRVAGLRSERRCDGCSIPRLHRAALGRDGCPPCPRRRHASPARAHSSGRRGSAWPIGVVDAEVVRAAFGAVSRISSQRT
jgi:hypothetical protein